MDINGVWASVNFPSGVTGFGGTLFSELDDAELGLACVRAWNDWLFEAWHGPYPERIVPLGITYLRDPELGAEEIRRNAKRGFTAVTMPEQPHRQGLPPVFDRCWEPIVRACAETGTVLNLHVGSSGFPKMPPGAPMLELGATLFQADGLRVVRRVALERLAGALPRAQDRDERGRHRLGGGPHRPGRQHHGALGLRARLAREGRDARPSACGGTSGSA